MVRLNRWLAASDATVSVWYPPARRSRAMSGFRAIRSALNEAGRRPLCHFRQFAQAGSPVLGGR